jgi:RNA polymerase sigma-70 factor, ECF subfamily
MIGEARDQQMNLEASEFESLRGRLFGIAYRMLGSKAEAEDIVQEAYVRWHQADRAAIRTPEAWLVTATTRLAIDRLRSLQTERDAYTGPWLPEPLMSDGPPPPDRHLDLASDLSIAFLVLLERLAPEERAAFLLHDVFDSGYSDIAELLGKSEAATRQIVHRARERVRRDHKRFQVSETAKAGLLKRFIAASEATDEARLMELFAPEATWTADGGGRTAAAPLPIVGAARIAKLVVGLQRRFYDNRATMHLAEINGETGLIVRIDGRIAATISIATDGVRIQAVYAVVNPDKLPAEV